MLSKLLILVVSLEWRCTTARSRRSVDDMDLIVDAQSFSRVGSSVGNGISAISQCCYADVEGIPRPVTGLKEESKIQAWLSVPKPTHHPRASNSSRQLTSTNSMAVKTHRWISLWFLLSAPIIAWDVGYCMMRLVRSNFLITPH